MNVCMYVNVCTCMSLYVCLHVGSFNHVYHVYRHVFVHVYMYTHEGEGEKERERARASECVCVCLCVCVCRVYMPSDTGFEDFAVSLLSCGRAFSDVQPPKP